MTKHILLSIQPRIVKEIIEGKKIYEFRKKFPNLNSSDINKKIIIYCSKPTMKIIGSFVVKSYHHSDFESLMRTISATKGYKKRISNYFTDKSSCHAMEISELNLYENTLSLDYLRKNFIGFCPGQSYRYLNDDILENILELNKSV